MMSTELLEIEPRELKITFEVMKQSSCSIQLGNKSDQYVAFKVKTTSPKKYCVRHNTGVIKPKATCDFTVAMQAQKVAPPNFQCKDKFLVQSTVVPFGTTEEDITSNIFSKESGKYVEEKKLKVVLISPPHSPFLLPRNGELKKDPCYDTSLLRDTGKNEIENIPPPHEANHTIKKLPDERRMATKEKDKLKHEADVLRKNNTSRVQVGFPFLYVCLVALISLALGYLIHP